MRKIECIERLINKNFAYDEICDWLIQNKFIDDNVVKMPYNNWQKAELIFETLMKAEKEDKIQLLYFEWVLLPLETIKITCTTMREEKVFTYGL